MSISTGTVQLSLADVDNLRDQIKQAQAEKKELEEQLVQVKADKRVVKQYITQYPSYTPYLSLRFDENVIFSLTHSLYNNWWRRGSAIYPHSYESREFLSRIAESVTSGGPSLSHALYNEPKERTEYINFDDVKIELRDNINKEVAAEVEQLKGEITSLTKKIARLEVQHKEAIDDINETNAKVVSGMEKTHSEALIEMRSNYDETISNMEKAYEELDTKYEDLLHERETKSKEKAMQDKVENLIRLLNEERAKPWYKKLFA